ncbi:MAG: MBL fold metallo-hydrolase [Proteobacteria bacterium]|nr:MBL fold metallo-hydrolase [Pseudomonadota bacterium]
MAPFRISAATWLAATCLAFATGSLFPALAQQSSKPASAATIASNAAEGRTLPSEDPADVGAVRRGLIEQFTGRILNLRGETIIDERDYDFLKANNPAATVNPSLWQHAASYAVAGLFKVRNRVYQLRGFDLANMTVIEGDQGLILVDPLTTRETARAALDFYFKHRPKRPVVAVIYTHSHIDHFGGVRGVVDEADVKAGKVAIIAPQGFLHEAISENVMAGTAMLRRAQYQGGSMIERSASGQLGAGIGLSGGGLGETGLIAPTVEIAGPYETRRIDGVEFEFQTTPGTEAPAEMNFYLPGERVLDMAENAVRTMHNVLTPRGAQVRDAKAWSQYLDAALVRYGDRSDVLIAQHLWPVWGAERLRTHLADARDMYAFFNNRALFLMNKGQTLDEIGNAMRTLPGTLQHKFANRGYYGTTSFNGRAVYQRYLGFYDGNPANLDPLAPVDQAKRYVAALGGRDRVLALVKEANGKGDYRWAAELGKQLVFAAGEDAEARAALADTLEQLGYQAESAIWRNMYLSGAYELRNGVRQGLVARGGDMVRALTPQMYFDLLAVRLDADKAQGHDMTLDWTFPDTGQRFAITVRNGVLTWREGARGASADVSVTMDKPTLDRINLREISLTDAVAAGAVKIGGNAGRFAELMSWMAVFNPQFNLVAP